MKILITGGSGQLGRELQRLFSPGHTVWAPPRAELDLGAPRTVSQCITRLRPDLVLHAAAWTDVDGCEADPERA
ncbi:MAG TPA: sugar nucleotide-binding protein, partial [Limnochordia bacterium]